MAIDFPNSPSVNDQYTVGDRTWTWNGTYWQTSTSMSTFTASDSEPVDSDAGDIWFDSTIGKTFVNYDGNWVEIGAAGSVVDVIADADADTKIQVESSADSDKIEFTTAGTKRLEIDASGHIIPAANETYDLGSASARFRDIYLSGASIDLGGATISSDGTNLTMPPVSNISGDFTVGTDVLHVDHANSRVGVGTTSPTDTLDVNGTLNVRDHIDFSDTTPDEANRVAIYPHGYDLYVDNAGAGTDNTRLWLNTPDEGEVVIGPRSGSSTLGNMRIRSDDISLEGNTYVVNGNVGIGVDSPAGKLTINHDNVDGVVDFADGLMFTNNAGGGATEWSHAGIVSTGSSGFNGNLVFGTDGDSTPNTSGVVERMRITSSGNVGINDSTPSHKLDVNGDVRGNEVFNQKVGPSYPSSAGWYTIATCPSGRASGLFNVHDPRSAYHGALTFYVNHLYGQETITLLNHNYYSGSGPITGIRVKGIGVYDGAAVQVYLQVSSGGCEVFLSENYGEQTWTIKDFIPDGTDPGGQSGTWSSFTQQQYINLNGLVRGSTYTTGTVYGSSKSFSIPHPTREDYTLNHGAIEGPENGVYHRGRCVDGTIVLPEYWDGLVDLDTVTVQLTPIGEHSNWVSSISGREVSVGGGECFYIAYGERVDIDPLVVESPMYPDVPPEIEGGP